MFRARVAAQGFTVVAMVAGSMYYSQDRQKTKELRKIKEERDAEEKRQRWIRELEARDEEEKHIKATLKKRREQIEAAASPAAPMEQETGSILGKMGLWSQGQEKEKEKEKEEKEAEVLEKKLKKENPKSSLGAIGEVMTSKKKDEDESRR